jgi:PBP1b-binding outer membrane lipoprotein LpoB
VRIIAALAITLTLAGCAQYEAQQQAQAQAQAAAIEANDDAKCQSYGAAPGSQPYIQCRMNLDNQRAQMRQMIAGALVNNMLQH